MFTLFKKVLKSIALVPMVLALSFLGLAILMASVEINYSDYDFLSYLVIQDKADAQFIFSFIIGGIFTLTIFSYTMVMNVLNRNINNYSPRLVPLLLSEKHHQIILGFTSGTIIYAMVLSLTTISDSTAFYSEISAAIGVVFSIISVFLFIYFIHSVSQSIHINYILKQVYDKTEDTLLQQDKTHHAFKILEHIEQHKHVVKSMRLGYLHQPNYDRLLNLLSSYGLKMSIHVLPGEFVHMGDLLFSYDNPLEASKLKNIRGCFAISNDVPLDVPEIGFKHLVEVSVKAASPALNDPGTSKAAIDYLTQLFLVRHTIAHFEHKAMILSDQLSRPNVSNKALEDYCFLEMDRYMKDDPLLSLQLIKARQKINA
ncbi:MAG: DUF2254 family protein [Psychroserpens sp.]|uniref:DUF2254 domain-containing protein n=1 Tax=Psychroserpens sp. TaxID=2020870 RepID=UPI003CB3F639